MNRLLSFLITLVCFSFSSCIEFEQEKIAYVHDEEKDELRVTLTYEGIFGNLDKGQNSQHGPDDITTADSLNQQQIEQLESVLEQKRAFFFSNWIFEYSASSSTKMLEQIIKENGQGKFGEPEKKLIKLMLHNIKVQNIGFYKNNAEQLCGAQTLKISNISQVLASANEVIQRQIIAHIPQLRKELTKNVPSAWSASTVDLIEKRLKGRFEFIRLEGNKMSFSTIMAEADQKKLTDSSLKDLPSGARVEFRDKSIDILIGSKSDEVVHVSKKCFNGYQTNALNYVREQHSDLLLTKKEVDHHFRTFMSGVK
ncbi:MAG TPA: hypothetical protein DCF87_02470 [Opitutae bacterium]|nr:hypothetical protein [Opitutae bacterium]